MTPAACPFCRQAPKFRQGPSGYWSGGCESSGNVCGTFHGIAYQPVEEMAIAQWNFVVAPFARLDNPRMP